MTDFSQATLDEQQRANLIAELAAYADTDLLCYFADEPKLYSQQVRLWEPPLRALEEAWSLQITRTRGVMPVAQPMELKQQCERVLSAYDDGALVAMAQLVTRLGSVLLAIAVQCKAVSIDEALIAAELDEGYQADEWGADADIAERLAHRGEKVRAAHSYLESLGKSGELC